MRKLTLKELEELNQINTNEIYRLRRIITQQGKDIASKDKLISGLAKQINNNNKQLTNNTITFDDLNIENKGYSKRALYTFDNGNKISIVGGMGFYGNGIDDWEVAILDNDNKFITKDIVEDSYDDVLYEQTPKDINNIINQIQLI